MTLLKCTLYPKRWSLRVFAALAFLLLPSLSSASIDNGDHALIGHMGIYEGGLMLGADYERGFAQGFGFGGQTRFYPRDTGGSKRQDGVFAIGGYLRPHFVRKAFDFYLSPVLNLLRIDPVNGSEKITLGPSLGIGLLYQFNSQMAFGVENLKHWVWFEERYQGLLLDTFTLSFRAIF